MSQHTLYGKILGSNIFVEHWSTWGIETNILLFSLKSDEIGRIKPVDYYFLSLVWESFLCYPNILAVKTWGRLSAQVAAKSSCHLYAHVTLPTKRMSLLLFPSIPSWSCDFLRPIQYSKSDIVRFPVLGFRRPYSFQYLEDSHLVKKNTSVLERISMKIQQLWRTREHKETWSNPASSPRWSAGHRREPSRILQLQTSSQPIHHGAKTSIPC